jgi:fumarate hydratase subunit beta
VRLPLLATHVRAAETVAYPELGTEALVRLELDRFPVFVAIDASGEDLYMTAALEWRGAADADGGDS